jgi:hypothetical protein
MLAVAQSAPPAPRPTVDWGVVIARTVAALRVEIDAKLAQHTATLRDVIAAAAEAVEKIARTVSASSWGCAIRSGRRRSTRRMRAATLPY